jgi:hypothetical protein
MKIILLGSDLEGLESKRVTAQELPAVAQDDEVVLVCHGMPAELNGETRTYAFHPQLDSLRLHALLLAQRGSPVVDNILQKTVEHLEGKCSRVFGLTTGWNSEALDKGNLRQRILDFLKSDELVPNDSEVQKYLGFDLPVTKLAFRVALEIGLRELETGPDISNVKEGQPSLEILLAPALDIASRERSLSGLARGIEHALADKERLRSEIFKVLTALRHN